MYIYIYILVLFERPGLRGSALPGAAVRRDPTCSGPRRLPDMSSEPPCVCIYIYIYIYIYILFIEREI